MKNKKKITCGIAAALMVGSMALSLTGCGGEKDKSNEQNAVQQGLQLEDKARQQINDINQGFKNADEFMTVEH
ncbi:hypothetical protein SAMN04487934_10268 [Eubacterium ruminantium]|nr:hypothetical protein SAMN04487934_10268 [Eubacterium ruminantium]